MNYYEHHLGDYVRDTAHLTMLQDGAYHRLLAAYYIREKPLPADHKECFKLARANTKSERTAVVRVLEEFFKLGPAGYQQKRADEQIAQYQEGEPDRVEKRENDRERKRRSRERRRALFAELRSHGITPHFDAPMSELEGQLSRVRSRVTGHNGHSAVTHTVTRDGTASQSHSPVPLPNPTEELPTPTPPKGGAVRHRRSPERSEKDAALEVWNRLVESDGAEPKRDSTLQAAIDAVGGWSRIQHRENGIDDSMVRKQFCEAYRSRQNGQ